MKEDVVSTTSSRIISIIIENMNRYGFINVNLENFDDCLDNTTKLRLTVWNEDVSMSQIVSDCLTLDEIVRVRITVMNALERYGSKLKLKI